MFKSSKFKGFKEKWNTWQLFCATDFESLMYPCFTFCRILGILPYKINYSTIKIYKPCYVLSTVITCVFCIGQLINLYNINVSKDIIYEHLPRKFQVICFHMIGGFMAVFTFILCKPRMRLIQIILKLSLKLSPKSYRNLSRLIHIKDIFGLLLLLVQTLSLFHYKFSLLLKINILYTALIVFQMDMLYMNCVCVLKACFKQINDILANLRELVANNKLYILERTYHKQKNIFLLMELKALKKQHLAISDTVQMLNMIFSLHLVVTTVMTFLEITFMLYFYTTHAIVGMLAHGVSDFVYDLFVTTLVIYYAVKLVLIIWACETGKNQATEISTTVHSVLNSTSDNQIKHELQLFSLQLMYHKNIFTAKGFTMDASLLTAMVGSITTYLLVLIQFLLSSCIQKSNYN